MGWSTGLFAQEAYRNSLERSSTFERCELSSGDALGILDELRMRNPAWKGMELVPDTVIQSPWGRHFQFHQEFDHIPVHGSSLKVNIETQSGKATVLSRIFPDIPSDARFPEPALVGDYLSANGWTSQNLKSDPIQVWIAKGHVLEPALRFEVMDLPHYWSEVLIDRTGIELEQNDLLLYRSGQDSLVSAWVFLPDPLTTAQKNYGPPYVDGGDANIPQLNAELVQVSVDADYDQGVFRLQDEYIKLVNYNEPGRTIAESVTPQFFYQRGDTAFEDVNIYYHVKVFSDYLRQLGYNDLVDHQIELESRAYTNDNSVFVSSHTPPRINFGTGGVDDGEDADVIVHEFTHAVQYHAAPGTNTGLERKSVEEGNGDYFAVSYSRQYSDHNWERVFSWDGHNEFHDGRVVNSTAHYPEDMTNMIHTNGEIWSSALMEIQMAIGREETDAILLTSLYNYAANMGMSHAAEWFILADSLLNNGANYTVICEKFNDRGFSTMCNNYAGVESQELVNNIELVNSAAFAEGGEAELRGDHGEMDLVLMDAVGREIRQLHCKGSCRISSRDLKPGVYVLRVNLGSVSSSYKLVKN